MSNEELIAEAKSKFDKAYDETIRICSINETTRMSIPANFQRDTDLILVAAITAGQELIAALTAADKRVEEAYEEAAKVAESKIGLFGESLFEKNKYAIEIAKDIRALKGDEK